MWKFSSWGDVEEKRAYDPGYIRVFWPHNDNLLFTRALIGGNLSTEFKLIFNFLSQLQISVAFIIAELNNYYTVL